MAGNIGIKELAQQMSHSEQTAETYYNVQDKVKQHATTSAFIKENIIQTVTTEPPPATEDKGPENTAVECPPPPPTPTAPATLVTYQPELDLAQKRGLLKIFSSILKLGKCPLPLDIQTECRKNEELKDIHIASAHEYLANKVVSVTEKSTKVMSWLERQNFDEASSSSRSKGLLNDPEDQTAFINAVKHLPKNENLPKKQILQALANSKECQQLGIYSGSGRFLDEQLRNKYKTLIRKQTRDKK